MSVNKPNRVRKKLAAGQLVTGTAIYSASPNIVEAVGYAGIDFVRIDTEHGWRQDDSLDNMIRAAIIADIVPIIRIDRDNPYLIRKALELGAGGVLVPHVHTAAEAREVVSASKFPPLGTRGFALNCTSAGWGSFPQSEWVEWSNTQPLVGVMIETVKAMPEINEILAVEGLDYVLFGAADFSLSLGLTSKQAGHPEVQDGLRRTIAAAKAAGKHVMFGVGFDDARSRQYIDEGITMLEFGHDTSCLQWFLADKIKRVATAAA